jgi:F0F1-type ATP synthase delta subunit
MIMLARHYAHALYGTKGEIDPSRFRVFLKARGHETLLPGIVRELQSLVGEKSSVSRARIHIVRKEHLERFTDELSRYARELSFDPAGVDIIEDPDIVGGFIIETGTHRIDGSFRKRLLNLYRRLMAVSV